MEMPRGNPKNSKSKIDANNRYLAKAYRSYVVRLRYDSDAEIIEDIERCKSEGISVSEYFRRLYQLK